MKKVLLVAWLAAISAGIIYIFWSQELKYSLPTPVPETYCPVPNGNYINLQGKVSITGNRPVFVHFFNPDCPCSRFNVEHFNSLVRQYSKQIDFNVVVVNKKKRYTAEEVKDRFNITVPVSFDTTIASICGVYSTPQAVLLNGQHQLYYRGNYNKSRYCTEKNSNYAQMAIDSLLANDLNPVFNPYALKPYGCELPTCTK